MTPRTIGAATAKDANHAQRIVSLKGKGREREKGDGEMNAVFYEGMLFQLS